MIKIKIDIEVMNHDKIIEQQKGKLAAMAAKVMPEAHQLVEKEIYDKVRATIENQLKKELANKGVIAKVAVY